MKLTLLTNFVPPYRKSLYEAIQRQCSDFTVLLSAPNERIARWQRDWGTLPVHVQTTLRVQSVWKHPLFSELNELHVPLDTLPYLIRCRPDVVISSEFGARSLQAAVYRVLFRRSKLILWATVSEATEHGRGYLRYLIRKLLLNVADAIIVNGTSGRRYIEGLGGQWDQLFVAPYTTDLQPFLALSTTRPPSTRRRFLYLGSLSERKGILSTLDLLSVWGASHSSETVELTITGRGPLAATIGSFVPPPNFHITLKEHSPYSGLPQLYKEHGILIFPTLADEWGVVVNEAMASGVPVLGSLGSQAVQELVTNGENGWTFAAGSPTELASAFDQVMRTPLDELDRLAVNARISVQDITPEAVAQRILNAIPSPVEVSP